MAFLIGGANTTSDAAYTVDNSVKMETNTYLVGAAKVTSTNRKIGSFSFWIKRTGSAGTTGGLVKVYTDANTYSLIGFDSNDKLNVLENNDSGTAIVNLITNAVYRDQSAWYHILVAFDTTDGTEANRVKLYVNGSQPSLGTATYPSQDTDLLFFSNTSGEKIEIGVNVDGAAGSYYLSEFLYTDGTALANTDTGEFDSDSPTIWKPIDLSSITLGNNGSWMEFGDSSDFGVATGKAFVANNLAAADQAVDSPTNNFCTLNPLAPWTNPNTFSEGNCLIAATADAWQLSTGTIGVTKGKWYWEVLWSGGVAGNYHAGVADEGANDYTTDHSQAGITTYYNGVGGEMYKGGADAFTSADYGTMDTSSDIAGIALNADDDQITIYKNGSAIVSNFDLETPAALLLPLAAQHSDGGTQTSKYNFGGCSGFAISSAANDENGYGVFEIAPPSGYLALCTKNLATDG